MDKNPCGEINLPGANPSTPPTKPGVYTNIHPSNPALGTVVNYSKPGDAPFLTYQMIADGNGNWLMLDVDHSEEAGRTTQALVDKLAEIEAVYELADKIGAIVSDEKAVEYNKVEEELIRRLDENPPLTVDTREGSMYDALMKPMREEMNRIAEEVEEGP